jgi:hypothetical protein
LHTDKAIAIDHAQQLHATKELPQITGLDGSAFDSAQDAYWPQASVVSIKMCPVARRIKGFDEGAMLVLNRLQSVGLFKFEVRQT